MAFDQGKADLANKLRENDPNLGPGSALFEAGVPVADFGSYTTDSEGRIVQPDWDLPKPKVPVTFNPSTDDLTPDIIITGPKAPDDPPGVTGGVGNSGPPIPPITPARIPTNIGAIVGDGLDAIGGGIGGAFGGLGDVISGIGEGIGNGIGYGVDVIEGLFDRPPQPKPTVEDLSVTTEEIEAGRPPQPKPTVEDLSVTTEEIEAGRPAVERPAPVDNTGIEEFQAEIELPEPESNQDDDPNLEQEIKKAAQNQAAIRERLNTNPEDWRVKLRLAPGATYLYKDPSIQSPADSILWPLRAEDGVIFPYTPKIDITYRSEYTPYDPTHANHRYYFYKGSRIESVLVTADFTAQDTREANYVLAVIHFFRSASKMFYGQDAERGAPPPLVYMSGLGQYQFADNPCVITQFNYMLPDDVDYIRADTAQIRGSLQERRALARTSAPSYSLSSIWARLNGSGLNPGATNTFTVGGPSLTQGQNPTYVPTKITISLELLPIQSRKQISSEFSLRDYANGTLLRKGFW